MALAFRGTISGTVDSVAQNLPMKLFAFSIVNNTGGAVTVTAYVVPEGASAIPITPLNKSLAAGETYMDDEERIMMRGDTIRVTSSGSVGYYFNMENIKPVID